MKSLVVFFFAMFVTTSAFAVDCSERALKERVKNYVMHSLDGETLVAGTLKISSDAERNHTSRDPEKDDVQAVMYASFDTVSKDGTNRQSFVAVLTYSMGSPLAEEGRCEMIRNIIAGVTAE